MLTTLEMARASSASTPPISPYNGEVEPLHGHTFQVTLRVSGEPDTSGMVAEFSEIKPAMRNAVAPLRRRTLVPGQAPELRITLDNDSLSITCGRKRYLLPAEDVTVLPQLQTVGLLAAELGISELPGTSATARVDLG